MKKIIGFPAGNPSLAMTAIADGIGQCLVETINDALHCYAAHPECWTYPAELDDILTLIRACDDAGLNAMLPEADVAKNPHLQKLYRDAVQIPALWSYGEQWLFLREAVETYKKKKPDCGVANNGSL